MSVMTEEQRKEKNLKIRRKHKANKVLRKRTELAEAIRELEATDEELAQLVNNK